MKQFEHYLNIVRNKVNESFDDKKLAKHVSGFIMSHGLKYARDYESVLEYLQNNDEDNCDDDSVTQLMTALLAHIQDSRPTYELRSVTVKYSDGSVINTNMAAHLSDEEIRNYYKIGKQFNLGNGKVDGDGNIGDNIQTVADVIINETTVNENYNMMVVAVPPIEEWFDVQISGIDGDIAKGFKYMDKTYCIRPKDLELFKANTGKLIKFKYLNTVGTKYMEFPEVKESRINKFNK